MNKDYKIRKIKSNEVSFLKDFTYYAIYVGNNITISKDILKDPNIKIYYENFKLNKDICYVCEHKGKIIAMIWSILFDDNIHGYGYVSKEIPELCMSVEKSYRNKGIGGTLLKTFLSNLKPMHDSVSLSVSKDNYAKDLYLKYGFKIYKENKDDYIMLSGKQKIF